MEDLRREMIELRQQLDKERSVRMMLEEQVRNHGNHRFIILLDTIALLRNFYLKIKNAFHARRFHYITYSFHYRPVVLWGC